MVNLFYFVCALAYFSVVTGVGMGGAYFLVHVVKVIH